MRKRHLLAWLPLTIILTVLVAACGANVQESKPAKDGAGSSAPSKPAAPQTVAEIAKYNKENRQAMLEEGSRAEKVLVWYTSHNEKSGQPLVDAFGKKYPWIKVEYYRTDSAEMAARVVQEYGAKRYEVDVMESTIEPFAILKKAGILQGFSSPQFAAYAAETREKNNLWATVRESYVGLGYNTNLLKREEVPKKYEDLLDPRWKGQMAIAGSSTGVKWVGDVLLNQGPDFLQKLAAQEIRLQNISGRALADLVISGEVPLSPTIFNSHVEASGGKGAPIAWVPLEPVVTNNGAVAVPKQAKHPNSAMLFADFLLSEEGQKIYMEQGYNSPRSGLNSSLNVKKFYAVEAVEDWEKSYNDWEEKMRTYFIAK